MNNIINIEYPSVTTFLGEKSLSDSLDRALSALKKLNGRMGEGSEFLGWMDLPSSLEEDVIINIENIAKINYNPNKYNTTKREIAQKILNKVINECDYFDLLREESPTVYNSLKEKLKYEFETINP